MKEIKITTKSNEKKTLKIMKDLSDYSAGAYATRSGFYITRDYGDGRIDIEFYNSETDGWKMYEEEATYEINL